MEREPHPPLRKGSEMISQELRERIEAYCNVMNEALWAQYPNTKERGEYYALDETFKGRKYARISQHQNGVPHACHAFVQLSTGYLCKSGGYKAPQRTADGYVFATYNLLEQESFEALLKVADGFGGHLYGGRRVAA